MRASILCHYPIGLYSVFVRFTRILLLQAVVIAAILTTSSAAFAAGLEATQLKCEFRSNPLGIETLQPRLSWVLESKARAQSQSAYQILAASTPAKLTPKKADLWDSGRIKSSESLNIEYAGKPLQTGQRVYWKVRVWDQDGKVSTFSEAAWFEMALLKPEDWQAKWITDDSQWPIPEAEAFNDHPSPLFRKEFSLDKPIVRARAYVTGLGYYEMRLNGERVGDQMLDPGWTTFSKRVLYSIYDVTGQLQQGKNALGLMLGNGWYNPLPLPMWGHLMIGQHLTTGKPAAIMQLNIEFEDGTTQVITTDDSWQATGGPVLRNSVYLGELYDARRDQPSWDRAGFDDGKWTRAKVVREPKLGDLHAQSAPPIRITRTFKPVKITEPKPGVFIFDFGQNFSGWCRLNVQGPAGTRVRMRSGELLYPDGTLNGMTAVYGQIKGGGANYRYPGTGKPATAFQLDEYVLSGRGREIYTPRFTFHGFRYVEVTGFPGRPSVESLEGLAMNSDVQTAGTFECSNELFNRIQKTVRNTLLANLFSVQSDCPHREKLAYGGDISVSSEMAMFNFDMSRFYAKAVEDLADAARPYGAFTETAPFVGIADQALGDATKPLDIGPQSGPVDYGLGHPLLSWQVHQYYGDRRLVEEQYAAAKRWVDLLRSKSKDHLFDNGISDHEGLTPKPRALTGTAAYYQNVKLLAQLARILGKTEDAREAEELADKIRTAFNAKFLKPGTGRYDSGTQVCQAFALYFDLVPENEKQNALDVLVKDVLETNKGHLSTGIYGTKYMLNALTRCQRSDVAYTIANQKTFPGWGHMLEGGATTLWEHWEFSDNTYSHNHPMFGTVSEWFFKALGGIEPGSDAVGFNRIIIAPNTPANLEWVRASYDSVRGRIESAWRRNGSRFELDVRIPVGATARVTLPSITENSTITESGKSVAEAQGVTRLGTENGRVTFEVASGEYHFAVTDW